MTAPLSSPDPVGAHPSVDELADLAEELVEPAAAEALRRHLDGCADCRETAEALAGIGTLLGEAPAPAMPADVAARLHAALAAAAAEADATDRAAAAPQGPHRGAAAPGPSRSPAGATHSATAPLGPPGRPTATASSPAGPGRPRPRRRRGAVLLGAAAALLAVGLGSALLLRPADRGAADTSARAGAPAAAAATSGGATAGPKAELSAGGTVYQDDRLAAQVQHLLTRDGATTDGSARPFSPSAAPPAVGPAKPSGSSAAPPAEGEQGLTGGGGAPSCPALADGPLLATDRGSYAGSPAELLVYAVPGRTDQLDVYLRSPDCGPVLLHRTVAAH
ncbi:zf-HC2 domain-containing protein [Kitasatospora sp. NPDC003701]